MGIVSSRIAAARRDGYDPEDAEAISRQQIAQVLGAKAFPSNAIDGYNGSLHEFLTSSSSSSSSSEPATTSITRPTTPSGPTVQSDNETHNFRKVALHCCWLLSHFPSTFGLQTPLKDSDIEQMQETVNALSLFKAVSVMIAEAHELPAWHLDNPPTVSISETTTTTTTIPGITTMINNNQQQQQQQQQLNQESLLNKVVRILVDFLISHNITSLTTLASMSAVSTGGQAAIAVVLEMAVLSEVALCLIALLSTQMCLPPGSPDENSQLILSSILGTNNEKDISTTTTTAAAAAAKSLAIPLINQLLGTFVSLTFALSKRTTLPSNNSNNNLNNSNGSSLQTVSVSSMADSVRQVVTTSSSSLFSAIATIFEKPLLNAFAYISWMFGRSSFILPPSNKASMQQQLQDAEATLREASLLLVLVLIHPSIPASSSSSSSSSNSQNMFRIAFNNTKDSHYENGEPNSTIPPPQQTQTAMENPSIDFTQLYESVTKEGWTSNATILLLYFLLQGNNSFSQYVLARPDCDTFLLPLLKLLYESVESIDDIGHQQSIYVMVIILLILTKDVAFSKNLHSIRVNSLGWFKEHYLSETTLGGLLILILVRLVQLNLRKLRDPYLHTNCIAILANTAPYSTDLPTFPSLRLVKLVEMILVKCISLKKASISEQSQQTNASSDEESTTYSGFLQAILRIICNTLASTMDHNPNFIYALLQQKSVFVALSSQQQYTEQAKIILRVVDFFEKELLPIDEEHKTLERIVEVISTRAPTCKTLMRLSCENLGYQYEEEPTANEFFSPLVWSIVYESKWLNWIPSSISLFPLSQNQPANQQQNQAQPSQTQQQSQKAVILTPEQSV